MRLRNDTNQESMENLLKRVQLARDSTVRNEQFRWKSLIISPASLLMIISSVCAIFWVLS